MLPCAIIVVNFPPLGLRSNDACVLEAKIYYAIWLYSPPGPSPLPHYLRPHLHRQFPLTSSPALPLPQRFLSHVLPYVNENEKILRGKFRLPNPPLVTVHTPTTKPRRTRVLLRSLIRKSLASFAKALARLGWHTVGV